MPGKIPNIKLIALDLDDTLLNDQRQISDENVLALKKCVEKGIYVVLCSGRAEDAILPFVRKLEIAGSEFGRYLIAINGCSIFDLHTRQQIFCRKVDGSILAKANEIGESFGLKSEVYTPDTIYYKEATKYTKLDVDLCGLKGVEVKDYENFIKQGFTKMLIPGDPSQLLILQEKLKQEFGDKAVIFTSKPYFLEILPPNCGKGEAITWLAEHIGIGANTTMGFGDSMNDESMIEYCAYGVAMQNALSPIKQIANFITDKNNNESGVGDFINKYVI